MFVGIASLAVADPAFAEKVFIKGKKTSYQILEVGNKAGGQSWKESGQYGCINDGKGTAINCSSDDTCVGMLGRAGAKIVLGFTGMLSFPGTMRPQHRALFLGSAGARMGRKGAVSVGGAYRSVPWRRLLNLCLSMSFYT